jgi:hypothetical protein
MKNVQPVVVVSPWVWVLTTFWKPILVTLAVLSVLLYAMVLIGGPLAIQAAYRHDAAMPTMYIPANMRAELTQLALTPVPTPRPFP